jgi:hypothetical protein
MFNVRIKRLGNGAASLVKGFFEGVDELWDFGVPDQSEGAMQRSGFLGRILNFMR